MKGVSRSGEISARTLSSQQFPVKSDRILGKNGAEMEQDEFEIALKIGGVGLFHKLIRYFFQYLECSRFGDNRRLSGQSRGYRAQRLLGELGLIQELTDDPNRRDSLLDIAANLRFIFE